MFDSIFQVPDESIPYIRHALNSNNIIKSSLKILNSEAAATVYNSESLKQLFIKMKFVDQCGNDVRNTGHTKIKANDISFRDSRVHSTSRLFGGTTVNFSESFYISPNAESAPSLSVEGLQERCCSGLLEKRVKVDFIMEDRLGCKVSFLPDSDAMPLVF